MPDRLTAEQRRRNTSRIRGKDTAIEVTLQQALHKRGIRFRTTLRLPGSPDLAFPRARIAAFVNGCFSHRCRGHYRVPIGNASYWQLKAARNIARDREAAAA